MCLLDDVSHLLRDVSFFMIYFFLTKIDTLNETVWTYYEIIHDTSQNVT